MGLLAGGEGASFSPGGAAGLLRLQSVEPGTGCRVSAHGLKLRRIGTGTKLRRLCTRP